MPKGTNNRKRNIISSFVDKKGTYKNQKFLVMKALDEIVAASNFISVYEDACKIQPFIEKPITNY